MRVDQQGSVKAAQFKLVRARHSSVAKHSCPPQYRADSPVANDTIQVLGAENDDELQYWMADLSRFSKGI